MALPSFILGYHGCDQSLADAVFAGKKTLNVSKNDYDWIGEGIYFWEHNEQRALDFARAMQDRSHPSSQKIKNPAVVGAVINLGFCLNLLDSRYIEMVRGAHGSLERELKEAGLDLPKNTGGCDLVDRKLDCAVIKMLHEHRKEVKDQPFDSVRAAFVEGKKLYPNAGFSAQSHIQVCIRDHRQIIGYFRPETNA
ncbi:MAG: hypothetical protein V3V20_06580 [Algisphaera sp.]